MPLLVQDSRVGQDTASMSLGQCLATNWLFRKEADEPAGDSIINL